MSKHANNGDAAENRTTAQNRAPAREAADIDLQLPDIGRTLSKGERGVLRTLLDPEYFGKGAAERAQAAGISVRRYHEIMGRADFAYVLVAAQRSALRTAIAPIIAASIETASKAGRDGYLDRRLLLEMGGYYTPHQEIAIGPKPPVIGVVGIAMESL